MTKSQQYAALWRKAEAAGRAAHAGATPTPMNVTDGRQVWHVPDGLCGFAGVVVPGNRGIGPWLRKHGIGHRHWPSGWYVSTNGMSQSVARAEAAANEIARVLRDAGEEAHTYSRLD